jgi:hypothetical protein
MTVPIWLPYIPFKCTKAVSYIFQKYHDLFLYRFKTHETCVWVYMKFIFIGCQDYIQYVWLTLQMQSQKTVAYEGFVWVYCV